MTFIGHFTTIILHYYQVHYSCDIMRCWLLFWSRCLTLNICEVGISLYLWTWTNANEWFTEAVLSYSSTLSRWFPVTISCLRIAPMPANVRDLAQFRAGVTSVERVECRLLDLKCTWMCWFQCKLLFLIFLGIFQLTIEDVMCYIANENCSELATTWVAQPLVTKLLLFFC